MYMSGRLSEKNFTEKPKGVLLLLAHVVTAWVQL